MSDEQQNTLPGAGAEAGAGGMRALVADPRYLAFWAVSALIGVIRWFQLLALGVYTFAATGSPLLAATVPLLTMAPMAVCGPLIGALADRLDRKALFAASLAGIACVLGAMAALASLGEFSFGFVALVSIANGVFWATDMPVRRRLLGDLSGAALAPAMSLDAATGNATRMLGPLLGGAVLQFFGVAGVFLTGAIGYLLCLGLLIFVRATPQDGVVAPSSLIQDMIAGVRHVRADASLRRILAVTVVFNLFGFPFTAMMPVIGDAHLQLDPFWIGALTSIEGLGAFLGALVVAAIARPPIFYRIYWNGTLVYIVLVGGLAAATAFGGAGLHGAALIGALYLGIGCAGAAFAAMQSTLTYLGAGPRYRSRVLGVLTLCIGVAPIGFLNIGWMADIWGAPTALAVNAVEGLLALALLGIRDRSVRRA